MEADRRRTIAEEHAAAADRRRTIAEGHAAAAGDRLTIAVGREAAGARLDQFLAGVVGSRAQAQRAIADGRVLVDGRRRAKSHLLGGGERIEIAPAEPPAGEAQRSAAPYRIVYQDPYVLVVDKPAGVVVHPGRGNPSGTLAQALAGLAAGGEEPIRAGIVHRLDRDTSGLLVVARSDAVHRRLKADLAARRLRREYLALVEGHPGARAGTIEAPIGRDRRDPTRMSIDTDLPREARTHFALERLLPAAALLRVTLDTGRTHQIRVHLAAIGHPIIGDRRYGGRIAYGLQRQFLHAVRLSFPHPAGGGELVVQSPLPPDLASALSEAERAATDPRPRRRDPRPRDERDGAARPQPPRRLSANRATGGRGREVRPARESPPEVGEGR